MRPERPESKKFNLMEVRQMLFEYMLRVKQHENVALLSFAGFLKCMHLNELDTIEGVFEALNAEKIQLKDLSNDLPEPHYEIID